MNKQQPRVFVTQEVRANHIDYSPARQFGEVIFCTIMDFTPFEGSMQNNVLIDEMRKALHDFDPKNDFIITTGSPVVMLAAGMILRERAHSVRVLRWDNRLKEYQQVTVNLI